MPQRPFLVTERSPAGRMTSTVRAVNYAEGYYANDQDYALGLIGRDGYGRGGGHTGGSGAGFPSSGGWYITAAFNSAPIIDAPGESVDSWGYDSIQLVPFGSIVQTGNPYPFPVVGLAGYTNTQTDTEVLYLLFEGDASEFNDFQRLVLQTELGSLTFFRGIGSYAELGNTTAFGWSGFEDMVEFIGDVFDDGGTYTIQLLPTRRGFSYTSPIVFTAGSESIDDLFLTGLIIDGFGSLTSGGAFAEGDYSTYNAPVPVLSSVYVERNVLDDEAIFTFSVTLGILDNGAGTPDYSVADIVSITIVEWGLTLPASGAFYTETGLWQWSSVDFPGILDFTDGSPYTITITV
jgi:hypothetical protein